MIEGKAEPTDWAEFGTLAESGVLGTDCRDGDSSGFSRVCTWSPWLLAELSAEGMVSIGRHASETLDQGRKMNVLPGPSAQHNAPVLEENNPHSGHLETRVCLEQLEVGMECNVVAMTYACCCAVEAKFPSPASSLEEIAGRARWALMEAGHW